MKSFLAALPAMLLAYCLQAQSSISGMVADTEGEVLIGANVYILNTFQGAITDINGRYSINNLPAGRYVVQASYIGYENAVQNVELDGDTEINFSLERKSYLAEEVIVTAIRAGDRSPVAYTNISREEIATRNMGQDIPYLLSLTPSLVSTSDAGTGIGYTSFRVRGTDMNRINITVNGIPLNDAESHGVWWVDLPDFAGSVNDVQIQRGVGTSTNGGAAFGATLNFQTFKLNPEPYAELNASYGSFNSWKASITAGTGLLKDKFSIDMRLSRIGSDGFVDRAFADLRSFFVSGAYYSGKDILKINIISGNERTYQSWGGVPKVRLENDLEGMRRYEEHWLYTPEQTEHMINSNSRTYNYYTYENQTDNYKQDHYQLLYSRDFRQGFIFNSAIHYTKGKGYYEEYKQDQSLEEYRMSDVIIGGDTISSTDLVRQRWLDNDFYGFTASLNYRSRELDIHLGGGWNRYDGRHFGNVIWAGYAGDSEIDHEWYRNKGVKWDWNIYTKVNYNVTRQLTVFGDLQCRVILHEIDGIDNDLRQLDIYEPFPFLNPKFGATFEFNNSHRLSASFAVAHREPNRDNFVDADPRDPTPTQERLIDYELTYRLNRIKYLFEATLYYMDYDNQLVLTGEINDVGASVMSNIKDSYRSGLELVAAVNPLPKLKWDFNLTLSMNKIKNFTDYVDDWDNGGQLITELGETSISFSPGIVGSNRIGYEPVRGLTLNLISKYVGEQYIDNTSSEDRRLDRYLVNDLQVQYRFSPEWVREIGLNLVFYNFLNAEYESNAWVYRYYLGGSEYSLDGYFPQAGFHVMGGVTFKF